MRRRWLLVAMTFGAMAFAVLGACSTKSPAPGRNQGSNLHFDSKATIVIDDTGVQPSTTTAHVGDALTVTNRGTRDHGLSSDTIETGTLHPGESTTVFLTAVATVDLHDRADPTHTARIEVLAESSS